jgi:hypothetical protein
MLSFVIHHGSWHVNLVQDRAIVKSKPSVTHKHCVRASQVELDLSFLPDELSIGHCRSILFGYKAIQTLRQKYIAMVTIVSKRRSTQCLVPLNICMMLDGFHFVYGNLQSRF